MAQVISMELASVDFHSEAGSESQAQLEPVRQAAHGTGLSFEDLRVDPAGKVAVGAGVVEAPRRVDTDSSCSPVTNKNCG